MEGKQLEDAQLYWATTAMKDLALDAAQDIPEVIRWADVLPSPSGIMGIEKPLPPVPLVDRDGAPAWGIDGHRVIGDAHPVVISWTSIMIRTTGTIRVAVWAKNRSLPAPIGRTEWAEIIGVTPTSPDEPLHVINGPDWATGILAFLAAACTLMAEPKVTLSRTLDARTGGTTRPETPPARTVTLVDLRPLRYIRETPSEYPGVIYRHRWVVRGHWTHQPYGEKRAQRRLTWINSYIKGPEGAPLVRSEKVNVWRR